MLLLAVAGQYSGSLNLCSNHGPRQFNPAIPPALDDLVMQLLVDDPTRRLPSANELRRQLQVMLAQEHLLTFHTSTSATWDWASRPSSSTPAQGKLKKRTAAGSYATQHRLIRSRAIQTQRPIGYTDDAILAFKDTYVGQCLRGDA